MSTMRSLRRQSMYGWQWKNKVLHKKHRTRGDRFDSFMRQTILGTMILAVINWILRRS